MGLARGQLDDLRGEAERILAPDGADLTRIKRRRPSLRGNSSQARSSSDEMETTTARSDVRRPGDDAGKVVYDDGAVRMFAVAAVFWGLVGMCVGF